MATNRITLRMAGPEENGGDVNASVFLKQIQAFLEMLSETDRVLSGGKFVDFLVSGLSHNSPAAIEIEVVPKKEETPGYYPNELIEGVYDNITRIQRSADVVMPLDYDALIAYRDLTKLFDKGINSLWVEKSGESSTIAPLLSTNIEKLLGPDEYEEGSVTGYLHHVNLHAQNVFTVYPTFPGEPKVRCVFAREAKDLRVRVAEAVDQYVTVYGRKSFRSNHPHPYEMKVTDIDVHPPVDELPKIQDLWGVAPDATGELSSEDFVRGVRNEWR